MNGELLLYQRFIANANFIFHHLQHVTSINNKKNFSLELFLRTIFKVSISFVTNVFLSTFGNNSQKTICIFVFLQQVGIGRFKLDPSY